MTMNAKKLSGFTSYFIMLTAITANIALADTPTFDRPGIAFSTSIVPVGSFAYELGLPDFQHTSDGGDKSMLYSLDTNIRAGLTGNSELQLSTPVFNYLKTKTADVSDSESGLGDSSLSWKFALPVSGTNFSWAALTGVTFATGDHAFSAGKPVYRLATAANLKLNDTYSTELYLNLTRSDGKTGFTLSPNFNFTLTDSLGAFVEAGFSHLSQSPNTTIAGGGFTWMVTPKDNKTQVQLDFSMDFGLNRHSPDFLGGFGLSIYTP